MSNDTIMMLAWIGAAVFLVLYIARRRKRKLLR